MPTERLETGWRPGLLGEIVAAHSRYYAEAWGFGRAFESKVAAELGAFAGRYQPARDRLFYLDDAEGLLGTLTIDGGDPALPAGTAHLRWFIVDARARGGGLGARFMAAAMDFLRAAGAEACLLDTFAGLDAARRLYEKFGFGLTEDREAETWGTRVLEQRFLWRATDN